MSGFVEINPGNKAFSNASSNDFMFYTTSNSQNILIGVSNANIVLTSNLNIIEGQIAINNMGILRSLNLSENDSMSTQVVPTSAPCFSNDRNGIVFYTSNIEYSFQAAQTEIMSFNSSSNMYVNNLGSANMILMKNRIINGDMRIDQRSNSIGHSNLTNGIYSIDRWVANVYSGSTGRFHLKQTSTPVPTGFSHSLQCFVNTTQATINPGEYFGFSQYLEGNMLSDFLWGSVQAHPIGLSFWVYVTTTGTFSVVLGNNSRSYVMNYTITSANSWKKIEFSIPGDTTGTWASDATLGTRLTFCVAAGSTKTTSSLNQWVTGCFYGSTTQTNMMSAANQLYVTGVQLEKGSMITPFEFRPIPIEMSLCQRYFEMNNNNVVNKMQNITSTWNALEGSLSSGYVSQMISYKVPKRAIATLQWGHDANLLGTWWSAWNSPIAKTNTTQGFQAYFATGGFQTTWAQGGWAAAAELWTQAGEGLLPTTISGMHAWYDLSSTAYVTLNGNSQVTQLRDRSGNNIHADSVGTGFSSLVANSIGGLSALQFTVGQNQGFKLQTSTNANTVIAVGKATDSAQNNIFTGASVVPETSGALGGLYCKFYDSISSAEYFRPINGDSITVGARIATPINTNVIYSGYYNSTTQGLRVNGSTDTTVPISGTFKTIVDNYIGAVEYNRIISYSSFTGVLSEIMFFNRALSTSEIQQIEGYLAHKYSLSASLPAAHPYKPAPP